MKKLLQKICEYKLVSALVLVLSFFTASSFGRSIAFLDHFNKGKVVTTLSSSGTPASTIRTKTTTTTKSRDITNLETATTKITSGLDCVVAVSKDSEAISGSKYIYGALSKVSLSCITTRSAAVNLGEGSFNFKTNRLRALCGFNAKQCTNAVGLVCNNIYFQTSIEKSCATGITEISVNSKEINPSSFISVSSVTSNLISIIASSIELPINIQFNINPSLI